MKDEIFENEVENTLEPVDVELEAMNELSRRGEELEAMNELIHEDVEDVEQGDGESDEPVYGIDEDGEVIVPDDDAEEILDEVGEGLLAVNTRLPDAQHIDVRAVDDQDLHGVASQIVRISSAAAFGSPLLSMW